MTRNLFGTDGVRGLANHWPMTPEIALQLGQAAALVFRRKAHRQKIIIGKDTRLSGYMIEQALASGICSMGADVYLVGPLPTPGIAFLTASMRCDAGVVISGSHNSFSDNGIKFFDGSGFKLPDSVEVEMEQRISQGNLAKERPEGKEVGRAHRIDDAIGRYIVFLKNTFPKDLTLEGMKIVLDCANGAAYRVAPQVFAELGAEVISLHVDPNGTNINLNCGSLYPQDLQKAVVAENADLGIAFDGDADRVVFCDANGEIVDGDRILYSAALQLKRMGVLKNDTLVATVMSNMGLEVALRAEGISLVRTAVGDRYVVDEMRRGGFNFGGESSGHLIFLDHNSTGDGILAALQLLAMVRREKKDLHTLVAKMPIFPQHQINIEVKEKPDFMTIAPIAKTIDEAKTKLQSQGRVLVRYSGTESVARVMVEGPERESVVALAENIASAVRAKNWNVAMAELGVNIDHVATLREVRGTTYPEPMLAAYEVEKAGAQQITVHLREDRRHIQDTDVFSLRKTIGCRLNLELAVTAEMLKIAKKVRPDTVTLVPEKRRELTTEGGLDIARAGRRIAKAVADLHSINIPTMLFLDPVEKHIRLAKEMDAKGVEIHTGTYCEAWEKGGPEGKACLREKARIEKALRLAKSLHLFCAAGHGLHYDNVGPLASLGLIEEYNIGHAIVARAVFVGLEKAVRDMLKLIEA